MPRDSTNNWSQFVTSLHEILSGGEVDLLLEALEQTPPVSFRTHRLKTPRITGNPSGGSSGTLPEALYGAQATPVPWCPQGYYLPTRPLFTANPLFHAGAFYVQEAGSMALWQLQPLLEAMGDGLTVLDACASPGGKSTLVLDLLPPHSILVSNEVVHSRVNALRENITKWGYAHTLVTSLDPSHFSRLPHLFDVILADVPCSGEGMFRKDPAARDQWSPQNVALCAARQRRILHHLWPSLRPGGLLVYSTCTFNRYENEAQIEEMQQHYRATVVVPPQRFMPHRTQSEGFFFAVLRKEEASPSKGHAAKRAKAPKPLPSTSLPQPLVGNYVYTLSRGAEKTEWVKAYPQEVYDRMRELETCLSPVQSGLMVATKKGNDFVPEASLATANDLRPGYYPYLEATLPQALTYLRKEALVLPPGVPKGYVLLGYKGLPIGFLKNLGNRSNNLYPARGRILSQRVVAEHLDE